MCPEAPNPRSPPSAEVVAIAASAGGLAALTTILRALPGDFPLPILVLMHLDPRHRSLLPELLDRATPLVVLGAKDRMALEPGVVYVAPPDRHLRVTPERSILLAETVPVHFTRPAADELFASVAEAFGPSAVGVICTGGGSDGAAGLAAIRRRGGVTIAQDQESCQVFGMPGEAIRQGAIALVLPLTEIAPKLLELAGRTEQAVA